MMLIHEEVDMAGLQQSAQGQQQLRFDSCALHGKLVYSLNVHVHRLSYNLIDNSCFIPGSGVLLQRFCFSLRC